MQFFKLPVRMMIIMCAIGILSIFPTALCAASVRDNYKAPLLTIPYTHTAPTIDGTINEKEWSSAVSINALQTTQGAVNARQARFWLMWDQEHFYLAMRSPLRPAERVVQAHRQTQRDNANVVFDDSYEIWLNADTTSPDGQPVFFQYLGNAAGARYDVMFEPAVGNSRPGWTAGWNPVNRITPDGKFWEWEMAIPRTSLYLNAPFHDGQQLRGLIVRNFNRPWEQTSIVGSGSFSAADTHAYFILSRTAPPLHLLDVADVTAGTLGAKLESEHPVRWFLTSDGGTSREGTGSVDALDFDKPGDGYYRLRITSNDGRSVYLDWCARRAFGDRSALTTKVHDTGEEADLKLTFNPVWNFVRVEGDFINYDRRGTIHRFIASVVGPDNKSLATQELKLDDLSYVRGLLKLGDVDPGTYRARLIGLDTSGAQVFQRETAFEKKDLAREYPWWNTSVGRIDRVIAPWTPIRTHDGTVELWGRSMTTGPLGLPEKIVSQDIDLLAAPAALIIQTPNGAASAAAMGDDTSTAQNEFVADYRVVRSVSSHIAGIGLSTHVTTEFDGVQKIQITLTPTQPVRVETMKLVIPLRPEIAQYVHGCGEGIRYGFSYGHLPADKRGRLWSSKEVDGQPMLIGSFIPYVWLGNDQAGLCWFSDSDEGWSPDNQVPAIEIRRDADDRVDLVLNLISTAQTLDQPRTITFGLQATPVKPLRSGWRMDTWTTADSFQDFCQVEPRGGHLIWNAVPFTLDVEACRRLVRQRQQMNHEYDFGFVSPKYHANAVPYFEQNQIDPNLAPEAGYFDDQWKTRVSSSLCFDKSLTDFIVYNLDRWCRQTGIDGWYVDNVRPVACDNIEAGRGYRLPDGRVQPTYQMFAMRDHFLRVRATFADNGKHGKIVLHMTHHMIMPWIGAADLALDGEDHVITPEMGKDFIDFWSLERMRLDYSAPLGTAVTFLQEYQGNWNDADLDRVMRAYTAMNILHDVLPSGNPNGRNKEVWRGRERFGIYADDVRFVPYWQKDLGITADADTIRASLWRRPGATLIAVVNLAEQTDTTLTIDYAKLGLNADTVHALDADTGQPLPIAKDGSIRIHVGRHDYRQVLISSPDTKQ